MKRNISVIIATFLFLALMSMPATATVLIKINDTRDNFANTINLSGASTVTRDGDQITIPIVDATLIAAGAANGGATSMVSSTAAIPVTYSFVNMIIQDDPAFVAKTLADGKKGQLLTLNAYNDVGSETLTVTPATSTGFSVLSFDSVADMVTLLFVDDTDGWVVVSSTSVTITP